MTLRSIRAVLLGAVLALPQTVGAQEEAEPAAVLKPVKLMTANGGASPLERQFFGQVAAKETVDLAFQVGGQVLRLPVTEGDVVPEGELIAQLDLETFQLQLEQAVLNKQQADRAKERNERLAGTVSQVAIEDAETAAGLAEVALRTAQTNLDHATLYAPFDALVARREVALFSTVSAGTPIARLHDMSELHVEIDVPELLFQRASESDTFDIVATFPGSSTEYPAEILEYAAEASAVGQTYRVTLRMDPPEDRQILPGASTTVKVRVMTGRHRIALPATAIVTTPAGETGVMIFTPTGADQGSVRWTEVEIEPNQFGTFDVLSGIADGDEVVLTGGAALEDGQAVRRFTGFSN
ncbi:efflux RND transporter periplasmic adaptor subunit [Epibacterium sp. MM17-32]|jgi:RND family efflux transporter MFP subunit|uniref:efflux RND transporter periplasmic adaptor subunit n=1 Tax=Epibacterium sp. MM17-32 TaxID=2917734 RepID=UPI001EF6600E|nr:efflux RND transporter periplasmic adaptor subunit [Epibacterium sp. MM17-32]MCG7627616.1 efflux RND transporter periplasmic adaptor subunit [Epibacterium sp. MM17-32]